MSIELIQALLKPGFVGTVVLLIGAVSGWGMSATPGFVLARVMRWWVLKVIVPLLKHPSWIVRTGTIFLNNALICMMLVASGGVPTGAWITITLVGLAFGSALRVLVDEFKFQPEENESLQPPGDRWVRLGLILNLVEVPAIGLALALSMGQLAVPLSDPVPALWRIVVLWTMPMLGIAAFGESLWMGRQQIFQN